MMRGLWMWMVWLYCVCALADGAPAGFRSIGDQDGIALFRRDEPGRAIPVFRGEVSVAAPRERIVQVLEDVAAHPRWMYRCADSRELGRDGRGVRLIYNRTDVPWPIWDRDAVLATEFLASADGRTLTLRFHTADPVLVPVPHRVVRMPRLEGFYEIRVEGAGRARVLYQVDADIGGSVPRWAAERVARDMPYHTLKALRERVEGAR